MTEPKTVADAQRLTLKKIKKCMELPRNRRFKFYPYLGRVYNWCGLADFNCQKCIVKLPCEYFYSFISGENSGVYYKANLHKLHRMVKEIEV